MEASKRAAQINKSITLELNAKAVSLMEQGRHVFNLTSGQLPFRPPEKFVDLLKDELGFLRSFQYGPVQGHSSLQKKIMDEFQKSRKVSLDQSFDCLIGNGGKHVISNLIACLINPGDEVVLLSPYWISYPEIVKFFGGNIKIVESNMVEGFVPSVQDIKKALSKKTKILIVNSPNNPSGVHYPEGWMKDLAEVLEEYSQVIILSDEIYFKLHFFDPGPTYFYQYNQKLLERTFIVDGISKILACTGLRIGYCIGPSRIIKTMTRFQGQMTSGASSLVQRALDNFDFSQADEFLNPIKMFLRTNANILKEKLHQNGLSNIWYQPMSAFYFCVDFSCLPVMKSIRNNEKDTSDYSLKICEKLLDEAGVATVPGGDFGMVNAIRISLLLEKEAFSEAMDKLIAFLKN